MTIADVGSDSAVTVSIKTKAYGLRKNGSRSDGWSAQITRLVQLLSGHASVPEVYIYVYKFTCTRGARNLLMNKLTLPNAANICAAITQARNGILKRDFHVHILWSLR